MGEWMTTEEAAKYLEIGSSNLYALAQQGRVPGSKLGKMWRFARTDLDAWVRANKPLDEFFTKSQALIEGNPALREPQIEGYAVARRFFEGGGRQAVMQIPVGCGKSGLISLLPFDVAHGRVLIIAPNLTVRGELRKNLDITNRRYCFWSQRGVLQPEDMTAGPYVAELDGKDANIHDCDRSHIVLANIQQLASSADRWLPAFPDGFFDLILVDEGHHSAADSWLKVFDRFPHAKVVNLTATPFRSDDKEIQGELIYRYSFRRAMLRGYIKRLTTSYVAPDEFYFTMNGSEKRYSLAEVLKLKEETWFSKGVALSPESNRHIVEQSIDKLERLRQSGTYHQLIAVACSVRHAKAVRSLYAERGYQAAEIHSQMSPDERASVLQRLRAGLLDCVIQVQILGEGFDHPKLSVAAIFRPFRSLSPFIQFIGRAMRVVVQHDPRHPDNCGNIVTHVGMNLDQLVSDFRDLDKEDSDFFHKLMSAEEPQPPKEVLEGKARLRLSEDMVVNQEVVSSLLEEELLESDEQELLAELSAQAEALGFDAEQVVAAVRKKKTSGPTRVDAAPPMTVLPQRARVEARRRLKEEVSHTAKVLLNRLELDFGSREISLRLLPGLQGNNFVAAVQLVNREVAERFGSRGQMAVDELTAAMASLEDILNKLTRLLKARISNEQEGKDSVTA